MSFGLGYIDAAALSNIHSLYSIKEDIQDNGDISLFRGGDNGLFSSEKSSRAEINLDLDFISDSDFALLKKILLNRKYANKVYFREPGYFTGALLTPSTATHKAYKLASNVKYPAINDLNDTEFTSTDYTRITGFTTPCSNNTYVSDYMHYLFTFDLSTWLASCSTNNLLRLSLFMQTPVAYRTNTSLPTDKFGIIVHAHNFTTGTGASPVWVEIYRRSVTINASNQQCASLKATTDFSVITDFIDSVGGPLGANKVAFLVSILQPRNSQGTSYLDMNYVALLVNGFMVKQSNAFNLNWRESYTGAGRTGSVKLSEV